MGSVIWGASGSLKKFQMAARRSPEDSRGCQKRSSECSEFTKNHNSNARAQRVPQGREKLCKLIGFRLHQWQKFGAETYFLSNCRPSLSQFFKFQISISIHYLSYACHRCVAHRRLPIVQISIAFDKALLQILFPKSRSAAGARYGDGNSSAKYCSSIDSTG